MALRTARSGRGGASRRQRAGVLRQVRSRGPLRASRRVQLAEPSSGRYGLNVAEVAPQTSVAQEARPTSVDDVVHQLRSGAGHTSSNLPLATLEDLAAAIYSELELADRYPGAPFRSLFTKGRFNQVQRLFITSSLLRAVAADPDAIPRDIKLNALLPFFDVNLRPIYKRLKLQPKDDNHDKWTEIVGIAPAAERHLTQVLEDITALTDVRRFQGSVMHAVNDSFVTAVIRPALPAEAFGAPFRDIVSNLALIPSVLGHEGFEQVEAAKARLADYEALSKAHGNADSHRYLIPLAQRLSKLLADHAALTGVTESASLQPLPRTSGTRSTSWITR